MKKRFYLLEEKRDEFHSFLSTRNGEVDGYDTYEDAKKQTENEIRGRRKGSAITIVERRETFKSPPSDVVSDDFNPIT